MPKTDVKSIEKLGEDEGKMRGSSLYIPSMLPVLQYLEDDDIRKEMDEVIACV